MLSMLKKSWRTKAKTMNDVEYTVNSIIEKPYKYAQAIGFKDVKECPHNLWMQEVINGGGDYTLLAHRGSYKSSVLSVCIALLMILKPESNIIFLRKADNDVSEMIKMVKKALESKPLQSVAMILYRRELTLTESTASSITTNLFLSSSGASQLLGIGLKSSITGKHADIVITDDICNVNDRTSKAERDRTKLQYQELQNIRNRGGRIINLGTRWHADDVFTLMDNINIYDYKATGLISDEQLQKIKDSMTASLFACNYELKIIASEDVIFENAQTGADPSLAEQGECHIDAAYGGEDYTAFTICRKIDGKYYMFGKIWDKHIDKCLPEIIQYRQAFNGGKIYCEKNADKGYLAKELKRMGERAVPYHEDMNKFLKITSYLKFAWKNVIFVQGTDDFYIQQILDYNEDAEHDDAPDSCASMIRHLWKRDNSSTDKYHSILD